MKTLSSLLIACSLIPVTINALPGSQSAIKPHHSLLIRNKDLLNELSPVYNMGYLLGTVGLRELRGHNSERAVQNIPERYPGMTTTSVGHYVYRIFDMAYNQQLEHNRYYNNSNYSNAKKLGPNNIPASMMMNQVFRGWKQIDNRGNFKKRLSQDQIKTQIWPNGLRSNKFRLLAIVNRMDLADEFDPRKTGSATDLPRFLGEVHLTFGLVDERSQYEDGTNPKPFPMTFSMSYRLPAINYSSSGVSADNASYDFLNNTSDWKKEIGEWAKAWARLSDYSSVTNRNYKTYLKSVLDTVLIPENFIGFRSNTKIRSNEFEIREWYIFRSAIVRELNSDQNLGQLIPRKPRMEPYECLDGSRVLTDIVNHFWQDGSTIANAKKEPGVRGLSDYVKRNYQDLDVHTKVPGLSPQGDNDEYRAGMLVLREKDRPFFKNSDGSYKASYIGASNVGGRYNYFWKSPGNKCGTDERTLPFAMLTGPGRNQPPILGSWSGAKASQLMMLAPFGRVRKNSDGTWGRSWKVSRDPAYSEAKRHAFSIRTCTGCHGQEGATAGFHIYPRLPNKKSAISGFLSGGTESSPDGIGNTFTKKRGTASYTYKYSELAKRKAWLWKFMKGTSGNFVRFKNLQRDDLK